MIFCVLYKIIHRKKSDHVTNFLFSASKFYINRSETKLQSSVGQWTQLRFKDLTLTAGRLWNGWIICSSFYLSITNISTCLIVFPSTFRSKCRRHCRYDSSSCPWKMAGLLTYLPMIPLGYRWERLGSRKEGPRRQPCLFASIWKSADISARTLLNMSYNAERPTGDPDVSESTSGGFFSSDFQR